MRIKLGTRSPIPPQISIQSGRRLRVELGTRYFAKVVCETESNRGHMGGGDKESNLGHAKQL